MLKQLNATKNTLNARTMITKRELSIQGKKRKCENIKVDKYGQMRSSRQNDKLDQWVMHRAVKHDILGSILGCKNQKVFSLV